MVKIGFIGAGKMAFALMKSLEDVSIASDVSNERLKFVQKYFNVTKNNKEVVNKSDVIFLCVKPQNINSILDDIKDIVDNKIIISIAAGITLKTLESKLKCKVVRVMPNTPCLVGEMAAGYSIGTKVNKKDVALIDKILNSSGKAFLLEEKDLDAVTALSGSGPAFFALFIQGLIDGAVKEGLDKEVATKLALQTAIGTGKLLEEMSPEDLIKMVSSPKGTTVAGLKVLKNNKLKQILNKTIKAASKRSKELGK